MLTFGAFIVRPHERELVGPRGPVELSARSFDILMTLLAQPDSLIEKAALLDAVWPGVTVEENTLQVHMSALRKALGPGYISTVHGRGYRYVGPAPRSDGAAAAQQASSEPSGNLHRYRVDCVAREAERAAVAELIGRHRLVSILGPGGVGKTTLSLAVAADRAPDFADGVWIVDLAPVADGALIESSIVQTMGIPFRAQSVLRASIVEAVRQRRVLLVLDNCEHLAGAVAATVKALLAEAAELRVLTTTQVPLGIAEENLYRLAPFGVASSDGIATAPSALFLAHCYAALGETLTDGEMPSVMQLCRRLDGMALALKMAAARAATLGFETVDRQLAEQLEGLSAGWDASPPRHRSLVASLAWSYDLLPEADRRTLMSLGVFNGSFTIEGARAVAGEAADDSLSELVRRSLVVRDGADRGRYRLLETMRQFALEKLAQAGGEDPARARHASFMARLFAESLPRWETTPDLEWRTLYQHDVDNLRAALDWARRGGQTELFVQLASHSYRFWFDMHLPSEGLTFCEAALPLASGGDAGLEARLRLGMAELARANRLDVLVRAVVTPAIGRFRDLGDRPRLAQALILLGLVMVFERQHADAALVLAEAEALVAEMPTSKMKARGLVAAGMNMIALGERALGVAKCKAGMAMQAALGNTRGHFKSTMMIAEVLHQEHDTEGALAMAEAIIPRLRQDGSREELGGQLSNNAAYWLSTGDTERGRTALLEAAALPHDSVSGHWCLLQNAAELSALTGDLPTAALLAGFVDDRFAAWPDGRQTTEVMQRRRLAEQLGGGLDAETVQRLMDQGRRLTSFEADHLAGFGAA